MLSVSTISLFSIGNVISHNFSQFSFPHPLCVDGGVLGLLSACEQSAEHSTLDTQFFIYFSGLFSISSFSRLALSFQVMYGGRVIDDFDRRIVRVYMDEYMGDFLFDTFQPFHFYRDESVDYRIPFVAPTRKDFIGEFQMATARSAQKS
jgi:Dynein heavy chain AAA lid domain